MAMERSLVISAKKVRHSLSLHEHMTCAKCPFSESCEIKDYTAEMLLSFPLIRGNPKYKLELEQFGGNATLLDVNLLLLGSYINEVAEIKYVKIINSMDSLY